MDDRVRATLDGMTLEDKVAQLSSVWVNESPIDYAAFAAGPECVVLPAAAGGITRPCGSGPLPVERAASIIDHLQAGLAVPALVHEECLTGLMGPDTTVMPAPLNWGATFDPDLVWEMAALIGEQLRSAGAHIGLAPVLDVIRDQRYGRVEECIAEDAYLVGVLGSAYVRGLQDSGDVLAAVKHFAGHAAPQAGHNAAPVHLGRRELADVHLLPFRMAVQAGAGAVMSAYHDLDGVPASASADLLTRVLRDEWSFDGIVVSDYWAVDFLHEQHGVAAGPAEAARMAVMAGVDLELPNPRCFPTLVDSVRSGLLDEAVVDRAAARVLAAKARVGLLPGDGGTFGAAVARRPPAPDRTLAAAVARRMAEASITLLSNRDGVLPLGPSVRRLAVLGPNAGSAPALCGNYSYVNHVAYRFPGTYEPGWATIQEAVAARSGAEVRHHPGCPVVGPRFDQAAVDEIARWADVAIVVVGDRSGHRGRGTVGEASDADDLALPGAQPDLLRAVVATGTPTVVVHVAGRAHDLSWAADNAAAILSCWFPGEEGAAAVAAVLFGDRNPAGRSPVTFSRGAGQQPRTYDGGRLSRQAYGHGPIDDVFCFGHGLSYTTFDYDHLTVDAEVPTDGAIRVSCTVRNSGDRAGEEVVQLYVRDELASVVRPLQQLRGFARVGLQPGEAAEVAFTVPTDALAFSGPNYDRLVEPGTLSLMVGASSADVRLRGTTTLVGGVHRPGRDSELRTAVKITAVTVAVAVAVER